MTDLQQELAACRERAEQGYILANESFERMKDALRDEQQKLKAAESQQNKISRLENDKHFKNQMHDMKKLEDEFISRVGDNLRALKSHSSEFTIIVYGRTMVGKSTLMEILTHGEGNSIGKGAQRTTRDVREYHWNGLKILDVPGVGAYKGSADDKVAYDAAKTADLALFLMGNDSVQPVEAAELHKLKELGKPILGIVNVKQSLALANTPQRKMNLKQIEKAMNNKQTLEDLVNQFKQFGSIHNDNFDDIPFVYSHLQSAFFAQRENNPELHALSNFNAVENFILEKFKSDGRFIRVKTFIDAVAEPMQKATEKLYRHSADSVKINMIYSKHIAKLDEWKKIFSNSVKNRRDNFISGIENEINVKINYVVENYYDSDIVDEHWRDTINGIGISRRCENFIRAINAESTQKLHEFQDTLEQDLKFSDVRIFDDTFLLMNPLRILKNFPPTLIGDVMGKIALTSLVFAPILLPAAIIYGIGSWLFGDSESEKRRKAQAELREQLEKSRKEIIHKVENAVKKIIDEEIFEKQIDGFRNILEDMANILKQLAYSQNKIADTVNRQYFNLNQRLLWEAAKYVGGDFMQLEKILMARIVGTKIILFTTTSDFPESVRHKISDLLSEDFSIFDMRNESYWEDLRKFITNYIVKTDFKIYKFCGAGDDIMHIIYFPKNDKISAEQIQLTQQIYEDPVVLD